MNDRFVVPVPVCVLAAGEFNELEANTQKVTDVLAKACSPGGELHNIAVVAFPSDKTPVAIRMAPVSVPGTDEAPAAEDGA